MDEKEVIEVLNKHYEQYARLEQEYAEEASIKFSNDDLEEYRSSLRSRDSARARINTVKSIASQLKLNL